MNSIKDFVKQQLECIENEHQKELEDDERSLRAFNDTQLEKKGICLVGLRVTGSRTGLGGKLLLDLEKGDYAGTLLPANQFRTGDIVVVKSFTAAKSKHQQVGYQSIRAIVFRVTESQITLSFDSELEEKIIEGDMKLTITRMNNEITYKRTRQAMIDLEQVDMNSAPKLLQVLLGQHGVEFEPNITDEMKWVLDLNESQKEAVRFALAAKTLALIHGPPGTGKTTTLVELINQLLLRSEKPIKILACGPSNLSVDNLAEKLSRSHAKIIRLGHPARLLPSVITHSLDVILDHSDRGRIIADIRKERDTLLETVRKTRQKTERKKIYQEIKLLRKEILEREKDILKDTLVSAQVILSTLIGSGTRLLKDTHFDYVIIDEISQAKEAECWIAIPKGERLIMAGDPCQLPPTIKSEGLTKLRLETTLFDRLVDVHGDSILYFLSVQYRMNSHIMTWSSNEFYHGKLIAHPSVTNHHLSDLPNAMTNRLTETVLMFIDTAGCSYYETTSDHHDDSKYNENEGDLVLRHVEHLVKAGISPGDIAVITPYNAQKQLILNLTASMFPNLEINSVDGFQGREKQVIILSMVRSNDQGDLGFLKDARRMNVAVTRAKRHFCLIGDSETLEKDPFLARLIDYISQFELSSADSYKLETCLP